MHKILVTGANGFVGSALCNTLSERNIPFTASVRKKTMPSQFQIGDLTGTTHWADALSGCDAVIHLAARVHVMKDKLSDPLVAYRAVNVDGTMNLARQAVELGIKRFVFVSSVKVNGETTKDQPFTSHDVPAPVDPYGQSKLEAEITLQELSRKTGMELVIVRPPLVYGPGVGANFLKLMQLVKLGFPLPLGNINNRRSMVALDNLIDLLILCAHHPEATGQIFMVSDDNDLSTTILIALIACAMDRHLMLLPMPGRLIEVCARVLGKSAISGRLLGSLQVDIHHAKEILSWQPVVSTDAAIQKTVSHFLAKAV